MGSLILAIFFGALCPGCRQPCSLLILHCGRPKCCAWYCCNALYMIVFCDGIDGITDHLGVMVRLYAVVGRG